MKKKFLFVFFGITTVCYDNNWVIVGGGPAAIITTMLLLDIGTPAKNICVIAPVGGGDLSLYPGVSANTKNKLWVEFLSSFKITQEINHPSIDRIFNGYAAEKEYSLQTIIEPLQVIFEYVTSKVSYVQDMVTSLYFHENNWRVGFSKGELVASHVVLATGSHPRKVPLPSDIQVQEISLIDALDKARLDAIVNNTDTVAVFGSAHSAILALKNLSELNVHNIINFYNKPIKYTVDMGSWYLNISSGLKGVTADWARNVLEQNPPKNLMRVLSTEENIKKLLPECTKVIHAVGFDRNQINIKGHDTAQYNDTLGVIAPRLFGIGIAFPEKYIDPLGNVEHRVGINSFTEYALRVVPEWAKMKQNNQLLQKIAQFEELLEITVL